MTGRDRDIPSFTYWIVKVIRDWLSGNAGILLGVFFMIGMFVSFVAFMVGLLFNVLQLIIWGAVGFITFGALLLYMFYLKEHDIISI